MLACGVGFTDMVHQVVYSVLLLNTDLHVADVSSHMSRQQFIKNTMNTIHGHAFSSSAVELPQIARIKSADARSSSNSNLIPNPLPSPAEELNDTVSPPSPNTTREREKAAAASANTPPSTGPQRRRGSGASHDSSELPDVRGSPARTWSYTSKGWEAEVETLLKVRPSSLAHIAMIRADMHGDDLAGNVFGHQEQSNLLARGAISVQSQRLQHMERQ